MLWVHWYVLAVAVLAIVLLATERAPMSMTGLGMIIALALWPGLLNGETAIRGFANPAVITVAGLFVVGAGFVRTGAASLLADRILHRTGGNELALLLLVMSISAVLSAFVNNTLVVVTLMPVITTICRDTSVVPSKLLIPLSYASILGGMCTLVGTSTNILVDAVLTSNGRPGLGFFQMTPGGVLLAGAGIAFMGLVGRRLLPSIPSLSAQAGMQDVREFVTEITVGSSSSLLGTPVAVVGEIGAGEGTRPVMLVRNERLHMPPFGNMKVKAGDQLMVSGGVQGLTALKRVGESGLDPADNDRYDPRTMTFFELALTPSSSVVTRPVGELKIKEEHGAVVAGLLRGGKHLRERFGELRLSHGDVLLAFGDERSKASLRRSSEFHLIEGIDENVYLVEKAPLAFLVMASVVALFVTGVLDIPIAALIGAFAMVATGCLSVGQAHRSVSWGLLAFIAGTLALSEAARASGLNQVVGAAILDILGTNPTVLVAGLFVSAIVMTEILSNNAVAIILTPIAVATAQRAGIGETPLIMAVVFGASCCFANPLGYQTNLLVFGPGGYRFKDYLKVGLPMDVLLAAVGIVTIPKFWPPTPV
ncbi:MAG: SLC13 family permease [Planctomycetes bacterium]|nr:SLC13 family permease [Planctomycetota bacterium]